MDIQRRVLLAMVGKYAALAAACTTAPGEYLAPRSNPGHYPFSLGVASGSPLPDAVVIWTRILANPFDASSSPLQAVAVRWEMAADEAFRHIVASGSTAALPQLAHSVHVDVTGLQPDRWYWYRFMLGDAVSPVGRTRTAPRADAMPAMLRLAVASCQHWEYGAYAAHRHIASASPDLVAFLGDYIYEWGPLSPVHPRRQRHSLGDYTLAHYRARHAQYKSDPHLQAAHACAPWIVTWDDHEVANDYAGIHDELQSPAFLLQRAAAYQAFYEHMPIRLDLSAGGFGNLRMYQHFDWGALARLYVLDNRQYRDMAPCTPSGRGGSAYVMRRYCAQIDDPARTMLGRAQEAWLDARLRSSNARWNVLCQQSLMAQGTYAPIVDQRDGRFWTDGWDGFASARTRLLESLRTHQVSNPLVLGGDMHVFYATELRPDFLRPASADNPAVASEFVVTSVTSNSVPQDRTEQFVGMNPHIRYGRSDKRGYMMVEVTPLAAEARFFGLDDVRDEHSAVAPLAAFRVSDGRVGPERVR